MITFHNLSKTYQSQGVKVEALQNLSLSLPDRGMVFLLGKSGSGKSTLLNVLGGLDRATAGELWVDGKDICKLSQEELNGYRNTYVGFVFQEYNLLVSFTVEENLSLAVELQGKKRDPQTAQSLLEKLDIAGMGGRKPSTLSGGQRQRVAIARAILKESKILLADEPTGALDSQNATEIFKILKEISKEKLVIVVSHDREFAKTYADRIIELKDGKIIADSQKNAAQEQEKEGNFLQVKARMPFLSLLKIAVSSLKSKVVRRIISVLLASFAFLLFGASSSLLFFDGRATVADIYADLGEAVQSVQITGVEREKRKDETVYNAVRLSEEDITELSSIATFHGVMHLGANQIYNTQCKVSNFGTDESTPEGEKFVEYLNVSSVKAVHSSLTDVAGFAAGLEKEVTLVCGEAPSAPNEIVISSYLFDVFSIFGFTEYALDAEWSDAEKGAPLPLTQEEDILGKEIIFSNCQGDTYYVPLTIVGVFQSNNWVAQFNKAYAQELASLDEYTARQYLLSFYTSAYESLIWVSNGFKETYRSYNQAYNDGIHPEGEGVYDYALCSVDALPSLLNKIVFPADRDKNAKGWEDDKGYTLYQVDNHYINQLLSLLQNINILSGVFLALSAAFALFAVLLLMSLITVSIEQKQKDVSILRALGAGKRDIFTLFFTESAFVAVTSVVLSFVALGLLSVFINQFFAARLLGFGVFFLCWQAVLLTPVLALVVALLSTLFPVAKIAKQSPAQLLKS